MRTIWPGSNGSTVTTSPTETSAPSSSDENS